MTPQQKADLKELTRDGWSETEIAEIMLERAEHHEHTDLDAEIARLDALDSTEWHEMQCSAHTNALDTCGDNGQPRDIYSLEYKRAYVATLSNILDSAGIAH
jgi:hypothetical protein